MVASHTTKKSHNGSRNDPSKKQLELLDQMVDMALGYIQHWTHKQVDLLNLRGQLVITTGKQKNEFVIGRYRMLGRNVHRWSVWNHNQDWVHDFYDRRTAVFYCVATQKNQFREAQRLLASDSHLGKLNQDRVFYEHRAAQARREKNWMFYDVLTARLTDTLLRVEYAQEQVEKNLRWAKYLKIQDTPHETTRTRN